MKSLVVRDVSVHSRHLLAPQQRICHHRSELLTRRPTAEICTVQQQPDPFSTTQLWLVLAVLLAAVASGEKIDEAVGPKAWIKTIEQLVFVSKLQYQRLAIGVVEEGGQLGSGLRSR